MEHFEIRLTSHHFCIVVIGVVQIDFDSRKDNDMLNDCMMTVDGTNFRIQQQGDAVPGNPFGSHKYKGKSALRYELGVGILNGYLVWIQGPYPVGKYNDIQIFNKVLANFLDPGKRIAMAIVGIRTRSSVPKMQQIHLRVWPSKVMCGLTMRH